MSRTPEEHAAAVRALLPPRPSSRVGVADAARLRARLAADVRAREDQPGFDNSQMDGYAVASLEPRLATSGPTIPAGTDPASLYPAGLGALAAPIMTGARLPAGTRAVVPVERCSPAEFVAEGEQVGLPKATAGQFCRRAGSDIREGEVLAPAGAEVTPALYGALVAQGIETVEVVRQARILIITGGAEVGAPGSTVGAASVRDTNGPLLELLAQRHGIAVAGKITTDDNPAALERAAGETVQRLAPDAVVTSGGISHGKFEVIRQVFCDGWYGHVAQQPGGPQGLSTFHGVPVLSLPGNPVSTLASFRLYVAPALGHAPEPVLVPLAAPVTGLEGREQFLRGRFDNGRAAPVGGAGSHLLAQAAPAQCLIRVPAGATLPAGDLARVYPL
ncbi:molybdopterin molybdotransferase MoeA [uncultured Corynebacterium sp.]|uniref:molybdopterin molybdotransferase MoeA n=1 Tax=uncultured Corynebacterium sp. TaxID=159447 RepID=UPI0025942BF6|nr:molybdopterin molybdotransferase MoeA [uncultured Corynebacterium sp.]